MTLRDASASKNRRNGKWCLKEGDILVITFTITIMICLCECPVVSYAYLVVSDACLVVSDACLLVVSRACLAMLTMSGGV